MAKKTPPRSPARPTPSPAMKPSDRKPSGTADRVRISLEFDRPALMQALFGQHDENLIVVEQELGVYLSARGHTVMIEGEAEAAARARDVLTALYGRLAAGGQLDRGDIAGAVAMSAAPSLAGLTAADDGLASSVVIRTRRKTIVPRSTTQLRYMEALGRDDVIFGDMKDKVDPYLRPLYDALYDMLPAEQVERRLSSGEIEIAPLAFMRGRTLASAFIILDEAQNTTPLQMKMFLTRFGQGSRMVVCGDPNQVDLPNPTQSGLADAVRKLDGIEGISCVRFSSRDVVRHPIVGRIVDAYEGPPQDG